MKKLLAAFFFTMLAVCALFAFAACGDESGGANGGAGTQGHTHNFQHTAAHSASCTEAGNVEYWFCSGCKKYYSDGNGKREITSVTVPALNHTFNDWRVIREADCFEDGTQTVFCSVCGTEGESEIIQSNGHSYGNWIVETEPDCTGEGSHYRTCSVCNHKETESVPANGHSYGGWTVTKEPTCSEPGSRYHVCSVCSVRDTGEIPATEMHDYDINNVCVNCSYVLNYTQDLTYKYNSATDSYTVSGSSNVSGDVVIPYYHEGKPVAEIAARGFSSNSKITGVIIPGSVTKIGGGAFLYCSALTSAAIPASVVSMGSNVFQDCKGLTAIKYSGDLASWCTVCDLANVTTPNLTLYIGGEEIKGDVSIPEGVTKLGRGAFYYCQGITSVTIPDSVTEIGDYAFMRCVNLKSVTIGKGVNKIGDGVFYYCGLLTDITFTGTKAEWNAIEKGYNWNFMAGEYTVHCKDGDIKREI